MGRVGNLISVPNIINKQVGSLIAWSTQEHSSKTLLWVFPHKHWIKINYHFTTKWETRSTPLPEGKAKAYKESFTCVKAPEELASRVVIAQIFYSDHQMLHNQHCITRLPGGSVTSVHSGHSCTQARQWMCSLLEKQGILHSLLLCNSAVGMGQGFWSNS